MDPLFGYLLDATAAEKKDKGKFNSKQRNTTEGKKGSSFLSYCTPVKTQEFTFQKAKAYLTCPNSTFS